ncbi:hypothetical protein PsorP6_004123 [Peronosclerospora sorghi]|uniref:Uncharacterized protein n=1 Tax=Peronosclerospora sorghi TaxID=230839 RepID=A0ACC0VN38_9STRA|nr:hypothetical protein PsorP6_004123 [Peronosclerospora sorghi]
MTMWNIRLRGPRGKLVMLQIDPNVNFNMFSVRCGFPPEKVEVDDSVLVKNIFKANDTVVVDTNSGSVAPVKDPASKTKKAAANSKRGAGKKDSETVARNKVHTLNPVVNAKKRASKRKIPGTGHLLGSSLESEPIESTETKEGEEKDDRPQRKYRRSRAIELTSKEAVEISLANAVSGQSNDRASKFFRAATKSAVEHQYELTLANARLKAALAHNFEIEELLTSRRAVGSAAKLRVRFKETPRKWKEEIVDLLKMEELRAILKYVLLSGGETGREMLKPFNMAQVSTRVFWSIVRLYDGDVAAGLADLVPDEDWSFLDTRTRYVILCYDSIAGLDLMCLAYDRVMSEKAREAKANEEQYTLWKKGHAEGSELSSKKSERTQEVKPRKLPAAKAKEPEVTNADMNTEEGKPKSAQTLALSAKEVITSSLRDAAAQAALARFDRNSQTGAVVAAFLQERANSTQFPAPADKEETEEKVEKAITVYCDSCKKARILSLQEAADAEHFKDPWTCVSLAKAGRSDGCDDIDDEVAQITGVPIAKWLQKVSINTRQELADASVVSTICGLVNPLDLSAQKLQERLEMLIDEARLDEINDWMSDLIGEIDVVERLETQKLGTPADLISTPSDLILEAVGGLSNMSIQIVRSWQSRAQELVDEHPWLADWRTL